MGIRHDFYLQLALAWDVLAYDRYKPASPEEYWAGINLQKYYNSNHEPILKLSDPQIRVIDALTEAVGIPHERGQAEIEIPKKFRFYNQLRWSKVPSQ
jgi:hypothetical protein